MFRHSSFSQKSFSPKSWRFDTAAPPPAFIDFGPGGWAPKSKRVRQGPTAYNLTRLHAEDREIVELLMVLVTKGFMDGYE